MELTNLSVISVLKLLAERPLDEHEKSEASYAETVKGQNIIGFQQWSISNVKTAALVQLSAVARPFRLANFLLLIGLPQCS